MGNASISKWKARRAVRSIITQYTGIPTKSGQKNVFCGFAASERQEHMCFAVSQTDVRQYRPGGEDKRVSCE